MKISKKSLNNRGYLSNQGYFKRLEFKVMAFMCYDCNINFSEKRALRRHIKSKHEVINLGCEKCEYTTDRLDCLKRHINSKHEATNLRCEKCEFTTNRKDKLKTHIESKHYQNKIKCPECSVEFSRKDEEMNTVTYYLEHKYMDKHFGQYLLLK